MNAEPLADRFEIGQKIKVKKLTTGTLHDAEITMIDSDPKYPFRAQIFHGDGINDYHSAWFDEDGKSASGTYEVTFSEKPSGTPHCDCPMNHHGIQHSDYCRIPRKLDDRQRERESLEKGLWGIMRAEAKTDAEINLQHTRPSDLGEVSSAAEAVQKMIDSVGHAVAASMGYQSSCPIDWGHPEGDKTAVTLVKNKPFNEQLEEILAEREADLLKLDLNIAHGRQLERIGELHGIYRGFAEADNTFRERIRKYDN